MVGRGGSEGRRLNRAARAPFPTPALPFPMPDSPDLPSPQDADADQPVVPPDTIDAKTPTGDAENAPADAAPDDPAGEPADG